MLLLACGLIITGHAVLTPTMMVILMITGDFLAMSLTIDRVRPSGQPNTWQIGRITGAAAVLGMCLLASCVAILVVGKYTLGLEIDGLRTLAVVAIVYGGQAVIYAVRDRGNFWGLRPTGWLLLRPSQTYW